MEDRGLTQIVVEPPPLTTTTMAKNNVILFPQKISKQHQKLLNWEITFVQLKQIH